jgi:hypothetical protein
MLVPITRRVLPEEQLLQRKTPVTSDPEHHILRNICPSPAFASIQHDTKPKADYVCTRENPIQLRLCGPEYLM